MPSLSPSCERMKMSDSMMIQVRNGPLIEVTKAELEAVVNSSFLDAQGILEGTWDAVHGGELRLEDVEDELFHLACKILSVDEKVWLKDLAQNLEDRSEV